MPRCCATKPNGEPCERTVGASQSRCYSHDPARKEVRRRAASRAGRSRSGGELGEVRDLLRQITNRVLDGSLDRSTAIAANQLLNTRVRLIEVARRVQEQDELLERLAELEERAALAGGSRHV
jgi:hypothetical protein